MDANLFSDDGDKMQDFLSDSESDNESAYEEKVSIFRSTNYTARARDIICNNVDITTENALRLNVAFQRMLKELRARLELMLQQCQERQHAVVTQLEVYRSSKSLLVGRPRNSGYICGQPFFKDTNLYPGPHNSDYLYRKNVRQEFFPLDIFEMTETIWTHRDKVYILRGIKDQMIEFLERENRLREKKCTNHTMALRINNETKQLRTMTLSELWPMAQKYGVEYGGHKFNVDWMKISNITVGGRHTVPACEALWTNYMMPGLIKGTWSSVEDEKLIAAATANNLQDWHHIASAVPERSPYQCLVRYQTTYSKIAQVKRAKWTPEEDDRLRIMVKQHTIGTNIVWNKVVENMPYRNKIQCYNRYMFTLMRPSKMEKFTPEEDCAITTYVNQYGKDFRFWPEDLLKGRTSRQIWARYNHTLKYANQHSGWTIEDDLRLMNYIKLNLTDEGPRKISWAECSKNLGNRSRLSCRTRYYTIEKFLDKNPNATLDDVPRKEKKLATALTDQRWQSTVQAIGQQPDPMMAVARLQKQKTVKLFCKLLKIPAKIALYEKMKFCFRYKFGSVIDVPRENTRVLHLINAAVLLMDCRIVAKEFLKCSTSFSEKETDIMQHALQTTLSPSIGNYVLQAKLCFRFPPNYNTLVGLRGVILNAYYPIPESETAAQQHLEPFFEEWYTNVLNRFRHRFHMLFYYSLLLIQHDTSEVQFTENEDPTPVQSPVGDVVTRSLAQMRHLQEAKPRSKTRPNNVRYGQAKYLDLAQGMHPDIAHDQKDEPTLSFILPPDGQQNATPTACYSNVLAFPSSSALLPAVPFIQQQVPLAMPPSALQITIIDPKDLPEVPQPEISQVTLEGTLNVTEHSANEEEKHEQESVGYADSGDDEESSDEEHSDEDLMVAHKRETMDLKVMDIIGPYNENEVPGNADDGQGDDVPSILLPTVSFETADHMISTVTMATVDEQLQTIASEGRMDIGDGKPEPVQLHAAEEKFIPAQDACWQPAGCYAQDDNVLYMKNQNASKTVRWRSFRSFDSLDLCNTATVEGTNQLSTQLENLSGAENNCEIADDAKYHQTPTGTEDSHHWESIETTEDAGHQNPESETYSVTIPTESGENGNCLMSADGATYPEPAAISFIITVPQRTYTRKKRLRKQITSAASHAWRWNHLNDRSEEEVQHHRNLWRRCDPHLLQFQACEPRVPVSGTLGPESMVGSAWEMIGQYAVRTQQEFELDQDPCDMVEEIPFEPKREAVQEISSQNFDMHEHASPSTSSALCNAQLSAVSLYESSSNDPDSIQKRALGLLSELYCTTKLKTTGGQRAKPKYQPKAKRKANSSSNVCAASNMYNAVDFVDALSSRLHDSDYEDDDEEAFYDW